VAGSALHAHAAQLQCAGALCLAQPPGRAAALMRVAQLLWRDAAGVDAADALPLYLRDKVALTEAERRAARSAPAPTR
jgi:tRNA threonylcarbamoyladenosine biosynthesis protein TsaB